MFDKRKRKKNKNAKTRTFHQNEANVSNFREIVSAALPFEAAPEEVVTNIKGSVPTKQNNESTLSVDIPTNMKGYKSNLANPAGINSIVQMPLLPTVHCPAPTGQHRKNHGRVTCL